MTMTTFLVSSVYVLATNESLLHAGRGFAVLLPLAALMFLITRRGLAGARRTGPANYAGGMYVILLALRWLFLAGGVVGLALMGASKL
jgi:hypothetical protein